MCKRLGSSHAKLSLFGTFCVFYEQAQNYSNVKKFFMLRPQSCDFDFIYYSDLYVSLVFVMVYSHNN